MTLRRILPWLLFLTVFIILYFTSYPSIGWWNSGEYVAGAYNLSIPDPGGSILLVLLGKFFISLLFFIPAVKAVTMVSIVSAGLSAVFTYYIMIIIFDNLPLNTPEYTKLISAFLTSLSAPFLYSIWSEATVSREYVLGLFLTSVLVFSSLKIWFSENEDEKVRFVFLIALIMGLDFTAHRLNTPFIPVFLLLLIFPLRKQLKLYRFWFLLAGIYLLGLSLNLFILIRSPLHPPVSMDRINNIPQLFAWINMSRFGQSNFAEIFKRQAPFWSYQVDFMYLRYFWWNFLGTNGSGGLFGSIYLAYMPFILGLAGFVYSLFKKFKSWILIFVLFLFFSFGLVIYANISEGFHHIREIDRLFIPSFFIFNLWAGIGLYLLTMLIASLLKKLRSGTVASIAILLIIGTAALPLNIFLTNMHKCDKSNYNFPYDFAFNLLNSCDKNAILLTNGDNDTYPLLCLQSVDNIRPDVAVINLSLLNADFYVEQMQDKYKLFPPGSDVFNPNKFRPTFLESPVEIKTVLSYGAEHKKADDTLTIKYSGRIYGRRHMLFPQDKALIALLENNRGSRPIYFANTVNEESTAGLSDYIATAGFAGRLIPEKGDSLLPDVLEDKLLKKFKYGNFNDSHLYIDRTTVNLFNNYRILFIELSRYYSNKGNKKRVHEILSFMNTELPAWRFSAEQNKNINHLEQGIENKSR